MIVKAASSIYDSFIRQKAKRTVLHYGDLKEWHRKLFSLAVPVRYYAGNFRKVEVTMPCLDVNVSVGPNKGTPQADVEREMKKFSDDLGLAIQATDEFVERTQSQMNRLTAATQLAAFAGGTIIRIHPFINGNGRIARLAMNFFIHRYLGKLPFFIDRPTHPSYSEASRIAMESGNLIPLQQYLIEIIALS
jgi:fido (protein-threonine AMPylation protein)